MHTVARAPARWTPEKPASAPVRRERVAALDNLKLLMVAVIIAGHGALAYGDLENAWPYQDVQEVQLGAVSDVGLSLLVIPAALFVMGLFFLISGMVTPASVARKGPRRFTRDRIVRLGLPLAVWTLLIWPGAIWVAHLAAGDGRSFWWLFAHGGPILDAGPMWFVEVLLLYSVGYALWCSRRPAAAATTSRAPLAGRTLVKLAVAISVVNLLVRPVFPAASGQIGQSHLWQWPQFVVMFGLGVTAGRRGWLKPVPESIRRGCGRAALAGLAVFVLVAVAMASAGTDGDVLFETGLHWPALALAVVEGPLAVGGSLWLLALAQRRFNRFSGPFHRAMARSAYGAFLLQGVVLIALMAALRPVPVPAEVKAITVASLGVAGSFALSWALVTRTRLGRVL